MTDKFAQILAAIEDGELPPEKPERATEIRAPRDALSLSVRAQNSLPPRRGDFPEVARESDGDEKADAQGNRICLSRESATLAGEGKGRVAWETPLK